NDFNIMISIDGPQDITDRYRIDRTGKGTFHVIMQNLAFLREYNIDYYSRKVSISSVLAPPFDTIDDILDFFANDKTLTEIRADGRIRASYVNTKETSFIEDFHLDGSMTESKQVSYKFIERLKKSILSHDLSKLTIEKKSIFSLLNNLTKRPINQLYDEVPPMGSCHIGMRRLFVRTDGNFYICEKGGHDYKIGDIAMGFDYEKIAGYYRKLEEVLEDCRDCWALIHCERCWVQLGDLGQFTGKKKEEFCSSSKETIETAFKLYTELLRTDPDSLKVFEDVTIV
ncbi:MAG: hypothetical protein GY950_06945, partial [bacterium]|nr:hypothetical protein [bacterium]